MATKTAERKWTSYDACACVEGFDGEEHDQETQLSAWQYLITTGVCWQLQGWYGRTAKALIERGLCHPAK
jgi:hypothetical protein